MILLILGGGIEKNLELIEAAKDLGECHIIERKNSLLLRLFNKIGFVTNFVYNIVILSRLSKEYKSIIVVKGLYVWQVTLRLIKYRYPQTPLVNWNLDSLWLGHNHTKELKKGAHFYDVLLNTKIDFESKLILMGFRNVYTTYQPISLNFHYRDVSYFNDLDIKYLAFVGFGNDERESLINNLSELDINIQIVGPKWKGRKIFNRFNVSLKSEELRLEHYAQFLNGSYASLGLLRAKNLDRHTSRTVEIPLAGSCLISLKNEEIDYLLGTDGYCAYSSIEDLKSVITTLWGNSKERNMIASKGHFNIMNNTMSYTELLEKLCNEI